MPYGICDRRCFFESESGAHGEKQELHNGSYSIRNQYGISFPLELAIVAISRSPQEPHTSEHV